MSWDALTGHQAHLLRFSYTLRLFQIPLVDVPNPNGLLSLSNQTYQVSPDSGSFFLWDAGSGPTGR